MVVGLIPVTTLIAQDELALRIADDCVIPLVRIEPGKFNMGRSSRDSFAAAALSFGEQADWATAGPVRNVEISQGFLMGKYKITAEQYCHFLNSTNDPERFVSLNRFSHIENREGAYRPKDGRSTFPVNVVPWEGARNFCELLPRKSGRKVRLPTEAEWEYAARGTDGRAMPWGDNPVVDWSSTDGSSVDAFPENSTPEGVVGLVDYLVGEWCSDFYGVRYIPGDSRDAQGPTQDQMPVRSDLRWLATVKGEHHVMRGRVKKAKWSTTARNLGATVENAGIYGFRVVVETDANEVDP